jgi:hypothetical protein
MDEHNFDVADSGDGNPATAILEPESSFVICNCADADTCDITMGENYGQTGQLVTIVNETTNACDFADSAGVSELAGAFAMGQWDSLTLRYAVDRWVEQSRSDN